MATGYTAAQLSYGPQEQPYNNAAAVNTAADVAVSTLFNAGFCTGLYVGGAGDVAVVLAGDSSPVTFKAVPVGTVLRGLKIATIKSTANGTTATNLVALV